MTTSPTIRSIFAHRNYRNLFIGSIASQFGSVIGLTSFTLFMLERFSQQPRYATITELMYSLPMLFVFFFVGVIADRMDRQRIVLACDWIRTALTLLLLLAVHAQIMPLVFLLLFLRTAVGSFFDPANSGLVQGILSKEERMAASGISQTTSSVFMLFGSGIGVLFYTTVGVEGAILADAISFAVSSFFISRCRMDDSVRLPNGRTAWRDLHLSAIWTDLKAGSRYIVEHRLLFALMKGLVFIGILNGGLSVLPLFMMKYKLAPDTYEAMSVSLSVASGVGMLIGAPLVTLLLKKVRPQRMIIFACLASTGLLTLLGLATDKWVFVALYGLDSFCTPFLTIPFFGWRAQIVDRKMMGRVRAWHSPIVLMAHSLTLGFIAWAFPRWLGIETLFVLLGLSYLCIGIYYLLVLPALAREGEAVNTRRESNVRT